ncbi:MAG: hypothetical protein ACYS7Y_32265 [Planctomycetota bacterium]|jgi:hypothetical protein
MKPLHEDRHPYDSKEDLDGYFALMAELDLLQLRFTSQPWVKALLAKREEDNANRVPMEGRTHPVTQGQYVQARKFFNQRFDDVKLYGYTLIPGDN